MAFFCRWCIGSTVSGILFISPILFLNSPERILDVRVLMAVFILCLWIACDMAADSRSISYYRQVKVRASSISNHIFAVVASTFIVVNFSSIEFAMTLKTSYGGYTLVAGTTIAVLGLLVRFAAIRSLGAFFTNHLRVLDFQPLVTGGIFSVVRHPGYLGHLLIALGICLLMECYWTLVFWAFFLVPSMLLIITREEEMLNKGFRMYERYSCHTWRLLPLIY